MRKLLVFLLLSSAAVSAQQPTALPSSPFYIRNTWFIGGRGNWNLLAIDPQSNHLYIAHGAAVQVVDVQTGALLGTISGFADARDIALDRSDAYGYISDGGSARVTVFDRGTLQKLAEIPTDPSPSALVLEPQTGLLFVICSAPPPAPRTRRNRNAGLPASPVPHASSSITVIDPQTRTTLGAVILPLVLGFAQAGSDGAIYINAPDRNQILRLDAQSVAEQIQKQAAANPPTASPAAKNPSTTPAGWITVAGNASQLRAFNLAPECQNPAGLAVDGADQRLFVACGNMRMVVVNAEDGTTITSLPVGPGAQSVGFDPDAGLIFVASGGGDGSLSIIHRNVTDTYSLVQTLPTRRQARTLAVNPGNGAVYLVTDYVGVSRGAQGGFGPLQQVPVDDSFQVLAIAR